MLSQTCLALTNVHVRIHKLRAEDGDANTQYVNRLISIGSKIVKNKKAASRTYRSKRKVRLSLAMAAESAFTAADPGGSNTEIGSHSESDSGRLKHTESWRLNRCKDDQVAWNQRLHALPQHCTRSLVYGAHITVPVMWAPYTSERVQSQPTEHAPSPSIATFGFLLTHA
ncbi:hypothetical protein DYB28_015148 [Aphanomyces astaci]|uniref:Uncharacterized protein n=1 Tax=Aphanomyces astaci TaxID=112090 RepID=A0A9X8DPG2_APHAT|nr:hypothetical protein DYB28_015148 [Aphanomyces astaci]